MSSLPESQENSQLNLPKNTLPGRSMFQLFRETFAILGRYFIIVYPVFLYFILSSLIVPKSGTGSGVSDMGHWAWWVIGIGLIAILFIFSSGWNVMMYKAVQEWEETKQNQDQKINKLNTTEPSFKNPFSLLKHFIPAMGEYGLYFLVGGFSWLFIASLPVAILSWIGYMYIGIPQFFTSLLSNPNLTAPEIQHMIETISDVERSQLYNWNLIFLAIIAITIIINGLTLFWQQYLVIKSCNPFKAFVYSVRHACRHPFKTGAIIIYFSLVYMFFSLLSGFSNITAMFGNFLLILTMVFFGLFMFLYLLDSDASSKA